jgi:DNA-3-methyladenine glycosylase II
MAAGYLRAMRYTKERVNAAIVHLRSRDPVMRALIGRVGPYTLRPQKDRFGMLVRSILSQQISTSAARSIRRRVEALVAPEEPAAENLLRLSTEQFRSAGVSPQKMAYLRDLCAHVLAGSVELTQVGRLDDEAVVEQLVQVKGIGRWTAQMFLMFSLGRLDVFPHDDLGIRTALKNLYRLKDLPDKEASEKIARPWRPYATVACWYCWRSFELPERTTKSPQTPRRPKNGRRG